MLKLISNTCQNLLIIVGILHGLSKCLDYKYSWRKFFDDFDGHTGALLNDLLLFAKSAEACNFTKSNTPPWVFFTFFKLHKWYQIA